MFKKAKLNVREQRIEDWFEKPMLWVTIILVVTLAVPILFDLPRSVAKAFALINVLIWFAFYVELFAKVYVAKSKWAALKRNWMLVIIALSPLLLPLRLIRVSKLLGLIRFLHLQRYVERLRKGVRDFVYNIEYILMTFVGFIFSSAFIMWRLEEQFDGSIGSMADALWWAAITVTTIGYGDVVPASPEGKIFGGVVSVVGTVLFMVFVARVTTLFVQDKEIETLKRLVKKQKKVEEKD
jgi:voltage-gated potassium channel